MLKKKETTIGFNLTERRITMVECKVNEKLIEMLKSAHGEIPPGLIQKGEIADFDSLLAFISEIVDDIKPQTKFASFNIPPGTYLIKKMKLPEGYIASNPELIKWEMRHQLLAPVEDYSFSHYYADGSSYFIAAQKKTIEQRIELLNGLGFVPVAADPASIILNNVFSFIEDNPVDMANVAMLELSCPYSTMAIIVDGVFYPGGCFVTDPGIFLSAFHDSQSPSRLNNFCEDIKAHFEMAYSNLGFKLDEMFFDTLVFSGGSPSSQVAIQAERLFNSSIYLAGNIKKKKKIKFKGKLHNLSFSELASAIGLALRIPDE
ncbi:MAG: hypothetical protein ACLFSQ_09235 [Candidatus Zixiibacteriota bacterium]